MSDESEKIKAICKEAKAFWEAVDFFRDEYSEHPDERDKKIAEEAREFAKSVRRIEDES